MQGTGFFGEVLFVCVKPKHRSKSSTLGKIRVFYVLKDFNVSTVFILYVNNLYFKIFPAYNPHAMK